MDDLRKQALIVMLWDNLEKDPDHSDRVVTGWGTKTKEGLCASIERAVTGPLPPKGERP